MAPRTRKTKLDDFTRDRIKTTQLVNRLHDHALNNLELDPSQVRAIEVLLRKSLPDLSTVTLEGGTNPILVAQVQRTIVRPSNSDR